MVNTVFIIFFNIIVGTIALIYGVNLLSNGLEKANVNIIKHLLKIFTGNVWSAFIISTMITALIQSSSAVMVITIGFINAGFIKLPQAVGIIYGANIGTTVTAQLMSLNLTKIAFPSLIIGFICTSIFKSKSSKNIGLVVMGLGLMFLGLKTLNSSIPYIKNSKEIYNLISIYNHNPYLCTIIGMIITMLVHSSSATVGLTVILFNAHLINLEAAIGLILGDNIGTCITAQLASLNANIAAKRAAWAHSLYNVIGAFVALIFFKHYMAIVKYVTFILGQDESKLIANAHTLFNIFSAILFLPITNYYVKFINWIIPEYPIICKKSIKRSKYFR
ncbi:MAG: phosphate:Na+ symporter [Clostridia bacterium]|jgi:phosphate:Na+ symporter|nr:phosphate:Na+ symporter [Clostridiales bacterium]MDN5324282.1 phosphate:Na+ symporter [Clostridia bacterium]